MSSTGGENGSSGANPVTTPTASASDPTPYTSNSRTTEASRALLAGTMIFVRPRARASIAIDSAPTTGRTVPSSASSPTIA